MSNATEKKLEELITWFNIFALKDTTPSLIYQQTGYLRALRTLTAQTTLTPPQWQWVELCIREAEELKQRVKGR